MPYIPPENRPPIDEAVGELADEIAAQIAAAGETAELSCRLRAAIAQIAGHILSAEGGAEPPAGGRAATLARRILTVAAGYGIKGGWTGELNYALTRLIQVVPHRLASSGAWSEALRYWIYAATVGALTRSAWEIDRRCGDDWAANALCGVLIDVKDEYKRRVNTAYEAAQILKSGDCFDLVPFRTRLVPVEIGGVTGYQEVMMGRQPPAR